MAGPYTMSQLAPTPARAVHTGVQVAAGNVTISGTTTAGSLVYLCQVPNGATIVDWVLYLSDTDFTIGGANQKIVIGTSASNSALGAFSLSGSASTDLAHFNGRFTPRGFDDLLPARISLSDDPGDSSVWLTAKFEVAPSTSNTTIIAKFHVLYTMDGLKGHKTVR